MQGLMLHCGANHVTRDELRALPEPTVRGPRHQPVHHMDFVEMVDSSLTAHGLTIKEEAFGITRGGERFFGALRIAGKGVVDGDDYGFTLGLRGSHDMSLPRGISGGSKVFVCDNLAFSGEEVVSTRQTTNIFDRLPGLVGALIERMPAWSERVAEQYDAYKRRLLTSTQADALLTGMVRQGIVMPSEMGYLIKEWDEPSHAEFEEPNVWRAFNAATETLKPRNPATPRLATLAPKTARLHALCDEFALAA